MDIFGSAEDINKVTFSFDSGVTVPDTIAPGYFDDSLWRLGIEFSSFAMVKRSHFADFFWETKHC